MGKKLLHFFQSETVFCIALLLAIGSSFWVPPCAAYRDYVDFRTLSLLLSLMGVVAGLEAMGIFRMLACRLLRGIHSTRMLTLVLVFLCFFSGMLITNDVALLTFVPFAIEVLTMAKQRKRLIVVVVMQTMAANMGSMLTPIGNPQNLYLYSIAGMTPFGFLRTMLPYTLLAAAMLLGWTLIQRSEPLTVLTPQPDAARNIPHRKLRLAAYGGLFALCLLTVMRVVPYPVTLAVVVFFLLVFDRRILPRIDYVLLLTFAAFFVFIGNMGSIPAVRDLLSRLINGHELVVAIAVSQVVSNVPAALLLSGFSDNTKEILIGVNLGGLGTLIASMASLISYKLYAAQPDARRGRYVLTFTAASLLFLVGFAGYLWMVF